MGQRNRGKDGTFGGGTEELMGIWLEERRN